jgi:hypothetical protein
MLFLVSTSDEVCESQQSRTIDVGPPGEIAEPHAQCGDKRTRKTGETKIKIAKRKKKCSN